MKTSFPLKVFLLALVAAALADTAFAGLKKLLLPSFALHLAS